MFFKTQGAIQHNRSWRLTNPVNSCAIGESMCLNSLRISRLSSVVAGGCDPIGLACLKLIGGRLGDTVAMLEGLGLMVGDRCKLHLGYQLKLKLGWIHWMALEAGDLLLLFSYFFLRSRGRLSWWSRQTRLRQWGGIGATEVEMRCSQIWWFGALFTFCFLRLGRLGGRGPGADLFSSDAAVLWVRWVLW